MQQIWVVPVQPCQDQGSLRVLSEGVAGLAGSRTHQQSHIHVLDLRLLGELSDQGDLCELCLGAHDAQVTQELQGLHQTQLRLVVRYQLVVEGLQVHIKFRDVLVIFEWMQDEVT